MKVGCIRNSNDNKLIKAEYNKQLLRSAQQGDHAQPYGVMAEVMSKCECLLVPCSDTYITVCCGH